MVNFPDIKEPHVSKPPKMSLKEYVAFCEFCVKNNPKITVENCMDRNRDLQEMSEPFCFQSLEK